MERDADVSADGLLRVGRGELEVRPPSHYYEPETDSPPPEDVETPPIAKPLRSLFPPPPSRHSMMTTSTTATTTASSASNSSSSSNSSTSTSSVSSSSTSNSSTSSSSDSLSHPPLLLPLPSHVSVSGGRRAASLRRTLEGKSVPSSSSAAVATATTTATDTATTGVGNSGYAVKELSDLEQKWIDLLEKEQSPLQTFREIESLIMTEGIPDSHRGRIWMQISGANQLREENVLLYRQLQGQVLLMATTTAMTTAEAHSRVHFEAIELDCKRMVQTPFYSQQLTPEKMNSIKNVLKAYALYDSTIGYVQGMSYIVMLMMITLGSEEQSFWLLVSVMQSYGLKELHDSLSPYLQECLDEFGELFVDYLPALSQHFAEQNLTPAMYMVEYYTSFYVTVLSFDAVVRVWDLLLMRIPETLSRTALAVLYQNHEKLSELSLESIIPTLRTMLGKASAEDITKFIINPPEVASPSSSDIFGNCIIS